MNVSIKMEAIDETVSRLSGPCNILVTGQTGSGKSTLISRLLREFPFSGGSRNKILYFYECWQPLFTDLMNELSDIHFVQGLSGLSEELEQNGFLKPHTASGDESTTKLTLLLSMIYLMQL